MGGDAHGHGHHAPTFKVPDWRQYKVEDVPELVKVQKHLAARGLKDPWLRNEVWRYHPGFGTPNKNLVQFFTRGMKWGFVAFVATIVAEKALGISYKHDDHGHGGDHGEAHH